MKHMLLLAGLVLCITGAAPAAEPEAPAAQTLDELRPSVARTFPACGADDVSPDLDEISVTFSKDMKTTGHCWSWCMERKDSFPALTDKTRFLEDGRTCVLGVELEPETTYAIWINTAKYQSFQDPQGRKAVPYLFVFRTGAGDR